LNSVPIGYETPIFPSLYWPYGSNTFTASYLFYISDIWRFTVLWTIILYTVFHFCAGLWAAIMHRKVIGGVWIVIVYVLLGAIQAIISGSCVGLLVGYIYSSGLFNMSTWIPLVWAVIQILFMVMNSYTMSSAIL
ncbi:hypothetical protein NADFUDRAFT_25637, partial [Nadsonia fulvescens var. elongata DSM 6958]